jgi:hypothetical protein
MRETWVEQAARNDVTWLEGIELKKSNFLLDRVQFVYIGKFGDQIETADWQQSHLIYKARR